MTRKRTLRGVFNPPREPLNEYEKYRWVTGSGQCSAPEAVHERGFWCTLPAGHRGDHVAHGTSGNIHARWARRTA